MKIEGYNGYTYVNDKVYNQKGKEISITTSKTGYRYCKMRNDESKWKSVGINSFDEKMDVQNYKVIPRTCGLYYINKVGEIISFALSKSGKKLIALPQEGKYYPSVTIKYDGKSQKKAVHVLIALSYIDKDYIEKGLCCLHLDNDKNNHTLSNLKVGTYSENNKQAYRDGLNKGNGLKKNNNIK